MKKVVFTITMCIILALSVVLVSCSSTAQPVASQAAASEAVSQSAAADASSEASQEAAAPANYPPIDLNSTEVFGTGPYGEKGESPDVLALTEEDKAKLKEGNFKVAICHHMLSNQVNQEKSAATQKTLKDLGIEVVAVTDAQFSADKLISDLETVTALDPDVIISMPVDATATASTFKKIAEQGIKIIFQENIADGMKPGEDYATLVNPDSYGHGKYSADILAQNIGYKGKIGMIIYDVPFFCTNERDRGFEETMAASYPDIEIVTTQGFTDLNRVGEVADAMFAQYPDLDGVYVAWEAPAEDVLASAQSAGLNDLVITTTDLGENTARVIALDGQIKGSGVPLSYETGIAEALAAANVLLGKEVPSYIITHSNAVTKDNVAEAYKKCFSLDPPPALADALKQMGK